MISDFNRQVQKIYCSDFIQCNKKSNDRKGIGVDMSKWTHDYKYINGGGGGFIVTNRIRLGGGKTRK